MRRRTPTVRARRLGLELRQMRREAGLKLEPAAVLLERAPSSLSRIERGLQMVRARDLPYIFDQYKIGQDDRRRHELVALAREANRPGWWQEYDGLINDPYRDYISMENEALEIGSYCPLLIPGLLQTEDYARTVIDASREWETAAQVEDAVKVRLARQDVLTRAERPLRLWTVIDEGVFRRTVGDPALMRTQLKSIVELATALPTLTVQVMPYSAGAHAGLDGGFAILTFDGAPDVVTVNHLTSTVYLEEPPAVSRYNIAFDHLKSVALSPRQSIKTITEFTKE
ncbi:helix-turn-helix domain-containing protein [Yinghuangia seranimata]|uniref:helix-turn-helix domain-containing protein n=1 Tax=Yinghuangia seranimata TaxID=408067 RepID=UPI00248B481A|nr:helix-turn-helix transcriptional regulator [Yinghuangia seranimata]MDI2127160.1 helix-turn-helix transcriptional regulator [Yinghuangia seranimata]